MESEAAYKSEKETNWINKQRVLIVASRGITERQRHLMLDIHHLLPHSKKEAKIDKNNVIQSIAELCNIHSARSFLYFEARRDGELFLFLGRYPNGPTVKFRVLNVHTSNELNLIGNCIQGSRHVLSFDHSFTDEPQLKMIKELFIHSFNVPKHHPKSLPCVDHVLSFLYSDNKIWFRNYQIKNHYQNGEVSKTDLLEIGPRFVLETVLIFDGSMSGQILFKNETFVNQHNEIK